MWAHLTNAEVKQSSQSSQSHIFIPLTGTEFCSKKKIIIIIIADAYFSTAPTGHFNRNTCASAYLCNYPISQSRRRSAVHKIMRI